MPKLKVAGINNLNNPAGSGGEEYDAQDSGTEADAVWYQVNRTPIYEALNGEDVRKAYLPVESRDSLDLAGVVYKTQDDVKASGMSHYILWLKE